MPNEPEINLIRKKKILSFINDKQYVAMKPKEIAMLIEVPPQESDLFLRIMDGIISEGKAIVTKRGKIMPPDKLNIIKGVFLSSAKGFGFVSPEESSGDIFISERNLNGAMHKDKVLVKLLPQSQFLKPDKREGEIIRILERGLNFIVGTYEKMNGFGFVIPDERKLNKDIFISSENSLGAVSGHKVTVKIIGKTDSDRNPEGEILNILGHINDPGIDVLSILTQLDIASDFPPEVYSQTEKIPETVEASELVGRRDLRNLITVTIDGADAKDLDDAISIEKLGSSKYKLGVHIADVAHYVRQNTPIYKEAYKRGTSIYPVDRVIPMLPHKLSNGICSLNPQSDRLTLSCEMIINGDGNVDSYEIFESVIKTQRRATYDDVTEILTVSDSSKRQEYGELSERFDIMRELSGILREKRIERGAIEFGFAECKIELDGDGKPISVKPYFRNEATGIIEEFMLVCNETVAQHYYWLELPFVYRTHEEPDSIKMENLSEFVKRLGYVFRGGTSFTKPIQKLLTSVNNSPEELIISKVVLRSMRQARYSPYNTGHFGLAAKYYCHFTSPIRRFPDLQIHHIIKADLNGTLDEALIEYLSENLQEICRHCCVTERTAEEAERETQNLKKTQYMAERIGQEFEGVISGIVSWGIYVELPNTIEGMISVNDLDDDYYFYDEENMQFKGERTKKIYRIGDSVKVVAVKADVNIRKIDFAFA